MLENERTRVAGRVTQCQKPGGGATNYEGGKLMYLFKKYSLLIYSIRVQGFWNFVTSDEIQEFAKVFKY